MAPSRGMDQGRSSRRHEAPLTTGRPSRSAHQAKPADVYREMLADAVVHEASEPSNKPLKRRRIATVPPGDHQGLTSSAPAPDVPEAEPPPSIRRFQTANTSSDESDESEYGFEDVELDGAAVSRTAASADEAITDVSISVPQPITLKRKNPVQHKGLSAAEKARRLTVHKIHLLCLLGHCIYINSICNRDDVQENLESILSAKTKVYLRANTRESQFDRNRMFTEGLEQALQDFRLRFKVTRSGMRRAKLGQDHDQKPADAGSDDRADFLAASKTLQGSQDTGNQLFCALLRGVGVNARLLCSLQPLPHTAVASKSTPIKNVKPAVYINPQDSADNSEASAEDKSVGSSTTIGKVPPVRRRLGQPAFVSSPTTITASQTARRPVRVLHYPVFWVEAFNAAIQKWIPVDPVVTGTMAKPSKLEPPGSYEPNQLSYVIAFESDGVARDVTRRYAKAFNAKTRRQRVESTADGTQWWNRVMRFFRRRGPKLDREQVEDAELRQKEAREGLPGNVQDFKDHPVYALERHLRRHEVIYPRREVGKVNAGTTAKPRMEAVFRRQDVLTCRSADKWFRMGREVKTGEQPLKHITSRRPRTAHANDEDNDDDAANNSTALYALHQTELYVPPPVVRGCVPRNAFGNLDVYVPSMVPAGGVHIRHPLTAEASKILRVDYADAVTGFQFKGRQGTAIIEGAVVPMRFADAVRAVIEGLEYERELEESRTRSLVALTIWARWMRGLKIKERVSGYANNTGEAAAYGADSEEQELNHQTVAALNSPNAETDHPLLTAGMYRLDELIKPKRTPRKRSRKIESDDDDLEDDDVSEETMNSRRSSRRTVRGHPRILDEDDGDDYDDGERRENELYDMDDGGGGFVKEDPLQHDPEETGGGFLADEDDEGGGFVVDEEEAGGGFIADEGGDGVAVSMDTTEHHPGQGSSFQVLDGGDGVQQSTASVQGSEALGKADAESSLIADDIHSFEPKGFQDADMVNSAPPLKPNDTETPEIAQSANVDAPGDAKIPDPAKSDQPADAKLSAVAPANEPGAVPADEEDEDMGSLLSHDPEDEDAEPDWLESD